MKTAGLILLVYYRWEVTSKKYLAEQIKTQILRRFPNFSKGGDGRVMRGAMADVLAVLAELTESNRETAYSWVNVSRERVKIPFLKLCQLAEGLDVDVMSFLEGEQYMSKDLFDLVRDGGKAYVYLEDAELGRQFAEQAEREGFVFQGGDRPTARRMDEIMCLNADKTMNYLGAYGRMAFGAGTSQIGSTKLKRIDYEKYISGAEDYGYRS